MPGRPMSSCRPEPAACDLDRRLEAEIPALRRFARRLVGRADEAEDLVQEVLHRALRYRHAFDPRGSLPGWLRRTALRALVDERARRGREPASGAALDELPDAAAERAARRGELGEELERLLARLAPVERDVLLRFHRRGESIDEIAAALDMPAGTVKSHLHRARRRLIPPEPAEDDR